MTAAYKSSHPPRIRQMLLDVYAGVYEKEAATTPFDSVGRSDERPTGHVSGEDLPHRAAPEPLAPLNVEVRDRLAVAPDHLFVYGTLQFPAVLEALLGRIPASTSTSATGWRAAALENRVYPGLVPANETAAGLLLTDLSVSEWRVLDDFEDDHYELRRLRLADGRYGWAYVWPAAEVLAENWSAEDFAARHLAAYAARCAGLAAHRDTNTITRIQRLIADHDPASRSATLDGR